MTGSSRPSGFSLVEVTLAIGIVGFALLGVFALIPVGLNSSRDAVDATRTSMISSDVQNRTRSAVTNATFAASADVGFIWYYDRQGVIVDTAVAGFGSAFYRAEAKVHGDWAPNAPPPNVDASFLRPVTVVLAWPVDSAGVPVGPNTSTFSFSVRKP